MLSTKCFISEAPTKILFSIIFAEETLFIFEKVRPDDSRLRDFISYLRKRLADKDWSYIDYHEILDLSIFVCKDSYPAYNALMASIPSNPNWSSYYGAIAYTSKQYEGRSYTASAYKGANEKYVHDVIKKNLSFILKIHIEERIRLLKPWEIFEELSDEDKEEFIYQLDLLC